VTPERPVTDDRQHLPSEANLSVVVIETPGGREFLWLSAGSPIAGWQIGDDVSYRNGSWRVVERADDGRSTTLTLRR
jgi:hypothetical protein